jgi:hypothetical protein
MGNLTNVVYPNSGSIVLGYDYANRLTNMVDGVGTTKFSWTAAGQLAIDKNLLFARPQVLDATRVSREAGMRFAIPAESPRGFGL